LLAWAEDCADVLASIREMWRHLAGVLPPGVRRRAFALPAFAVSAVFLAGAWRLHVGGPRRPSRLRA
jgi:hypothetical protein